MPPLPIRPRDIAVAVGGDDGFADFVLGFLEDGGEGEAVDCGAVFSDHEGRGGVVDADLIGVGGLGEGVAGTGLVFVLDEWRDAGEGGLTLMWCLALRLWWQGVLRRRGPQGLGL